jgi:hypothetical protein
MTPLVATHVVVYISIFFLLALVMALFARHGAAGSQQIVLSTLRSATRARVALRVAAISSTVAFLVTILILAIRWSAA